MEIKIDKIIKSKRKTLGIEITSSGNIIVRAPKRIPDSFINKAINDKKDWIIKKQTQILKKQKPGKLFEEHENFLFLGKEYPLFIERDQKEKLTFKNNTFFLSEKYKSQAKKIFTEWYKKSAKIIFTEKLNKYSYQYNFRCAKLRVSNAKRQWGSCNAKNNISLSWRLIMADDAIIDYVIIHELVHTKVKNHSQKFWQEVHDITPAYKNIRKWLKENGHLLNI